MNPVHFLLVGDLSGRLSKDLAGSERVTSAAVAIDVGSADELRASVARNFKKWRESSTADCESMVELLCSSAAAVSICSFAKNEPGWTEFWEAAKPLQDAIVRQDRRVAGFAKPANAALFVVFNFAFTIAMAKAVKECRASTVKDSRGMNLYEQTVVIDSDLKGDENQEVFRDLWFQIDKNQPRLNQLGLSMRTHSVVVSTEEDEPLLLLADFAAGLGQSASMENTSRAQFPIGQKESQALIEKLVACGKGVVTDQAFDFRYEEMFGDAYTHALSQKR